MNCIHGVPAGVECGYCTRDKQIASLRVRVAELEDAIRGIVLCTKEPGGACVCIQYAETILNKK